MNNDVMFSSAKADWSTPQALVDAIETVQQLEVDVCATSENAKCARYYSLEDDGLSKDWTGFCWMNPPYGRAIKAWMKKAHEDSRKLESVIICLVPARTDTAWWHDYVVGEQILYFRGRIKFGGHKNSAPFPSALVLMGGCETLKYRIQNALIRAKFRCA